MKIFASNHITSWQINREKSGTIEILFSQAPKSLQLVITATKLKDSCSLEEKLLINLDRIFKSRDITLQTKVHIVKVWFFQQSCMDVRVGP